MSDPVVFLEAIKPTRTDLGRVAEVFRAIKLKHTVELTPDGYFDIAILDMENDDPASGWSVLRFSQSGGFLCVQNWP